MADIREPVEITALTKNIPNIIDAVTVVGTLHWFETQLVAKAFIPHQTAQGIIDTQGVPPAQKARQLMESVFAQIRGSSERKRQWFNEFVDIFSHDTAHQGLVERLRREVPVEEANSPQYQAVLQYKDQLARSLSSGPDQHLLVQFKLGEWLGPDAVCSGPEMVDVALDKIATDTSNYEIFIGMLPDDDVMIKAIVEAITKLFPTSTAAGERKDTKQSADIISPMPDMDKKILQRKAIKDTNYMIELYGQLRSQTEAYLDEINCNLEKLLVCIMDVQHIKRISKECPLVQLQEQTSISGIFLQLVNKNLISFIQYSILKRIITEICLGCKKLQDQLKSYEKEFNQYIMRRVCETRLYQEGRFKAFSGSSSEEKVELLIITDDNWNHSIEFVKVFELEQLVASCFNIDRFSLKLHNIESNCLRIYYAISLQVAKVVFPLTDEEWKKLSQNHIVKIQCLGYIYSTDEEKVGASLVDHKEEIQYLSLDHFIQFGEGLGVESGELQKVWQDRAVGRYLRAVESLVMNTLQESQDPVEKLARAVSQMKTPESARTAVLAVQKVVMSVNCLTVLLKRVQGIHAIGQLLRISDETLTAIDTYYKEIHHKLSHILSLWLLKDHEDPVADLRDALTSLGEEDISQTLVLLTSLEANTEGVIESSSPTSVDSKAYCFPWKAFPVIRGADIVARTTVEITPDQPLDFHWKGHGSTSQQGPSEGRGGE